MGILTETVADGGVIDWRPGNVADPAAIELVLLDFPTSTIRGGAGSIADLEPWHDAGYAPAGVAGVYMRAVPGAARGVYELRMADPAAPWASEWTARLIGAGSASRFVGAASEAASEVAAASSATVMRTGVVLGAVGLGLASLRWPALRAPALLASAAVVLMRGPR